MQSAIRLVLIAGFFAAFPKSHAYGQETPIPLMSLNQWTNKNVLISNNVTSVIQAKTGFLWITTYAGIMRFDGKNFEVYNKYLVPYLTTGVLDNVYEDKHGALWFVSRDSGIVQFKNNAFNTFPTRPNPLPKAIKCLLIEDDGTVWVGSYYHGLYRVSNENAEPVADSLLRDVTILDIIKDHTNTLWIATDGYGLFKFDGVSFEQFTEADGMRSNFINALAFTADGEVLAGTTLGLNVIKNNSITSHDLLGDIQINALKIDSAGSVWIGTENGLARITRDEKIEFADEKNGFPYAKVNSIDFDREGNVWVSTERNGLLKLRDTGITNFTTEQDLSSNLPNIISRGPDKTLFIGSSEGTVDEYSNGVIKPVPIQTKLGRVSIRDILFDDANVMWLATYKGVLKRASNGEQLITKAEGLPDDDIVRILKDSGRNYWFASRTSGVAKFTNDKKVAVYNKETGLSSNNILAMEQDSEGRIYFGTTNGGLNILSPDSQIKTFHVRGNDDGVSIFNIHIDSDEKVWLVTNIGLYHFDGTSCKAINLKKATRGETFFDCVEDGKGDFWLTSNEGVLKLNRTEIKQYLDGKATIVNTKLYDENDGMRNRECTGTTRAVVSASGKLWIPTSGGVTVIDPEKVINNISTAQPFITSFSVDDKLLSVDSLHEVKPGSLRYTIAFTTPNFTSPSHIQFKYKLDGIDRFWVDAKTNRQIEYTNLPPGTYTFRVITSMENEVWSTVPASITFTVLPFFYETVSFYILIALVLGSGFLAFYKWRVYFIVKRNRELQKLNNELDRFVYSASHDLRAPLSSILGLVSLARLDKSDHVETYLSRIESSIQKLDSFIHDIIDFSRNARIEMKFTQIQFEPLIHQIVENLKFMDEHGRIKRTISIKDGDLFYTDQKRLAIILNNLVSNAFKYHNPDEKDPFILIEIRSDKFGCTITVTDNGLGIDNEHIDKIFNMFYRAHEISQGSGLGLYIVHETVTKLKGKITVHSTVGKGTSFKVTLPSLKRLSPHRFVAALSLGNGSGKVVGKKG